MTRRGLLAGTGTLLLASRAHAAETPIRVGLLQFGTLQWLVAVIRRQGLASAGGFALHDVMLANNDAGRVALMARAADVVLTDWLFIASRRAAGVPLSFVPFSNAAGGIMVPDRSPVRDLADLAGKRIGVAGGPVDRSWLVVRAAARRATGHDLAASAQIIYAAPPLLNAKLQQGELDAVLTFWTFAARLQAAGYRQAISVADCARALGLAPELGLLGFGFHEDWANRNSAALTGFIASCREAARRLVSGTPETDALWTSLRPIMQVAEGPAGDSLFAILRERFSEAAATPIPQPYEPMAQQVLRVLLQAGGPRAAGDLTAIPDGTFWHGAA